MNAKKIFLIIGGTGFIGSNLCDTMSKNHIVYLLLRRSSAATKLPQGVECIYYDDDIASATLRMVEKFDLDNIIYLASSMLPASNYEQYLKEKAELHPQILMLLKISSCRGIVFTYFSSGGTVYGDYSNRPYKEVDRRLPISYYGLAKKEVEDLIIFFNRNYGLKYFIFRPSNPYGPRQENVKGHGLISTILTCIRDERSFNLWGEGGEIRDYIYIQDLVDVVLILLEKNNYNEIYNISSGTYLSVIDVINAINALSGGVLVVNRMPKRAFDVSFSALDNSKLLSSIDHKFNDFKVDLKLYMNYLGL